MNPPSSAETVACAPRTAYECSTHVGTIEMRTLKREGATPEYRDDSWLVCFLLELAFLEEWVWKHEI